MMEMFEVGGCVRDEMLGLRTKDVDFVVLAPSFDAMRDELERQGFKTHVEKPEFVTIRAGVPEGHALRARTKDADFVLARKDSATGDGRRPDSVEPGTLADDLARRDFTVNAMAKAADGTLVDPHGGADDLKARTLRFVGDPHQRIAEDGLRVLRGFRFCVTKGFDPEPATAAALVSPLATEMLGKVSVERISDEINRMCEADTMRTLDILAAVPFAMRDAIFRDGLRLSATLKG
jgi:tRNA nucleotidyltransferase/poly(A) polymerase